MEAKIENDELKIKIPLRKYPKPSRSGRTMILASTGGNLPTDLHIGKQRVYVGITAYFYPEDINHG